MYVRVATYALFGEKLRCVHLEETVHSVALVASLSLHWISIHWKAREAFGHVDDSAHEIT